MTKQDVTALKLMVQFVQVYDQLGEQERAALDAVLSGSIAGIHQLDHAVDALGVLGDEYMTEDSLVAREIQGLSAELEERIESALKRAGGALTRNEPEVPR